MGCSCNVFHFCESPANAKQSWQDGTQYSMSDRSKVGEDSCVDVFIVEVGNQTSHSLRSDVWKLLVVGTDSAAAAAQVVSICLTADRGIADKWYESTLRIAATCCASALCFHIQLIGSMPSSRRAWCITACTAFSRYKRAYILANRCSLGSYTHQDVKTY